MKRWLLGLLTLLCMVSMVACSKTTPSLEGEWLKEGLYDYLQER